MGVRLLQGGFRDGEIPLNSGDAVTNPFYGGQPATIDASGARLAKSADQKKFIGVFAVSSYEARKTGVVTILAGAGRFQFTVGSASQDVANDLGDTVEGAPYDTTVTFTAGDLLYISSTGKWTNTGTAGQEKGIVIKGQTSQDDSVIAYIFPVSAQV